MNTSSKTNQEKTQVVIIGIMPPLYSLIPYTVCHVYVSIQ